MGSRDLSKQVLCLVTVLFLTIATIAPNLNLLRDVKAEPSSVWQDDFVWLIKGNNGVYEQMQKILDAFRFTYFKLDLTAHKIALSDFVSNGQKKYSGIILQDGGDVGTSLSTSEIQAIINSTMTYGLNLIVVQPERPSIKSLLGINKHQVNGINPYNKNYRVSFAQDSLLFSFSGSKAERDVTWNYLYNFTVTDAKVLATYNDTRSTNRPFFSVKQQPSGSLCFSVGIDVGNLDDMAGDSRFMPVILMGIALRDSVPSYRFMRPVFASLIADDQILQDISFQTNFLKTLKGKDARAAFGFIPKYYGQVDPTCVANFIQNSAYWELITHGNDHSSLELTTDYGTSVAALQQSVARMESLQQATGIGFERVQVFPNEEYIQDDFRALRDENFLTSMSYYKYNGYELNSSCRVFDFSNFNYPSMGRDGIDSLSLSVKGLIRALHLFHAPIVFYFHAPQSFGWLNNTIDFINGLGNVTWKKPSEIVSSAYDAKYEPATGRMSVVISKVRYPSLVINSTKYYYDLANSDSTHLYVVPSSADPLLESLTGIFQPAFNLTGWSFVNGNLIFSVLSEPGAVATTSIYTGYQGGPLTVKINGLNAGFNYDAVKRLLVFNVTGSSSINTVQITWGPLLPDTQPPTYDSEGYTSNVAGSLVSFYCRWQDNRDLSGYVFSTNNTGVWVNETWTRLNANPAWANVTKRLNDNANLVIAYKWYCNDTSNNWNETATFTLTTLPRDVAAPTYSNISVDATIAGNPSRFSVLWQDNVGLAGYVFSTNNTGVWRNDTFTRLIGLQGWANVTKTLNGAVGGVVGYRWYCVDTSDNWNDTGVRTLITTYSAKPQYSHITFNTTQENQPSTFSSLWTDDQALSGYIFGTNASGTWLNDTWSALSGSQAWANKTKMLPRAVGVRVVFQWWCNDSQNQWTTTGPQYLVTTVGPPPKYSNIRYSTSIAGRLASFSSLWVDDTGLSGFIFSTNNTGVWRNDTWTRLSGNPAWANVTKILNNVVGTVVEFKWYCNNTDGNWNVTRTTTLTTISPILPAVFGKTTIGKTLNTVPVGYAFACRLQAPDSGTATLISAYIHGRYQSGQVKAMIYSDLSGSPDSLLFQSASITLSAGWAWHNFTVNYNLEAGKYYWFAIFASVELEMCSDAGATRQQAAAWGWTYPNVPSKFNGVNGPIYASNADSIFVTFTPSSSPDTQPPTYSNVGYTTNVAGASDVFYCRWQDDRGLSGYIFSTNNTGKWVNDTWVGLGVNPAWANVTKILTGAAGIVVAFKWYCNDTSNNWSQTSVYSLMTAPRDTQPPKYSDISVSSTVAGSPTQFRALWKDNVGLVGYVFSTNNTGHWTNDTMTGLSGLQSWANVTKTLSGAVGDVVGYRWYCVDSSGNWNDTGVLTLTTTYSAKPQFASVGYSTTQEGAPSTFSSLWTDDQALSGYIFGTNASGTWLNDTWTALSGSQAWANKTKMLPSSVGVRVVFQWWCNDSQNQWTTTGSQYLVTTMGPPPKYSNIRYGSTVAGSSVQFSCLWQDSSGLSGFIFSTNNTGVWRNDTWTALSGVSVWANVTKVLNSTVGVVVGFRWYCNDTNNLWNSTNVRWLTTTSPVQPAIFGKTSIGASTNTAPTSYVVAFRFQAPENGTATLISAYIHGRYQSGLVKALIYSDLSGAPNALLFTSAEITLSASWAWHNFTVNYNLEAGKYYWFAIYASTDMEFRYDTGVSNQMAYSWGWTYPTVPATFNSVYGPSYTNWLASVYVTYMPSRP